VLAPRRAGGVVVDDDREPQPLPQLGGQRHADDAGEVGPVAEGAGPVDQPGRAEPDRPHVLAGGLPGAPAEVVGQPGEGVEDLGGARRRGDLVLDDGLAPLVARVEGHPEELGAAEVQPDDQRPAGDGGPGRGAAQ
jgi:hypothetical protein